MKKYKKYIIGVSAIIVFAFLGTATINKIKQQSITKASTIAEATHAEKVNCDSDYKNIKLSIDLDNKESNQDLELNITDPNGNKIDTIEIKAQDEYKYEKYLTGIKGEYNIEFNKPVENGTYRYNINFDGKN